jgi:hypothetical protein
MFYIGIITQRQGEGVPQQEAMIFHCEKYGEALYRRDYGAHEFRDRLGAKTLPEAASGA